MAPDRKDSTRSLARLSDSSNVGNDRKSSVKERPHSSVGNAFGRKEPLTSSSSTQGLSRAEQRGLIMLGLVVSTNPAKSAEKTEKFGGVARSNF